jgi:hypothetical protein
LFKLPPRASIRVSLDTSERPQLRPENPQRTFQLEDRDAVLVFEQKFAEKLPRRPAKPKPLTSVPYRIQ